MSDFKKINVTEMPGYNPYNWEDGATMPDGTIVLHPTSFSYNQPRNWKLRIHDGRTPGGESFADLGSIRFNDNVISHVTGNSILIAPGGESICYAYLPGNNRVTEDGHEFELRNQDSNGKLSIGVSTSVWTFEPTGITFPDESIQTTAWAGGRITTPPASSKGQGGDTVGDLSFDGSYFYYCTESWSDNNSDIWRRVSWNEADTWGD